MKRRVSGDLFDALLRNNQTELTEAGPAVLDAIQASASSHLQNQEAIRPRSLDLGFNIFVETLHIEKTE